MARPDLLQPCAFCGELKPNPREVKAASALQKKQAAIAAKQVAGKQK